MAIKITQEEFDKKFGDSVVEPKAEGRNYFGRVADIYNEAGKQIVSGVERGGEQYQRGVDMMNNSSSMTDGLKGLGTATGGLLRSGLRSAGNFAGALFAPITAGVEPVVKPVVTKALEVPAIQGIVKYGVDLAQQYPEVAKDIQNIIDIATSQLGAKLEKPFVKGAATVAGKGTDLASKALTASGNLTKATGRDIAESAIRPTQQEAQKILSYEAKNTIKDRVKSAIKGEVIDTRPITRGTTAFEQGIVGTEKMIGVQAKRATSPLWKDTIQPALKGSKEILTKDELFAPIVSKIAKITDPILKQQYKDAFSAVKSAYKKSSTWTLEQAQKLKEDLAEFIPESAYKGKLIANELKSIKADMADAIRQKIYSSFKDKTIKNAYIAYGNLKQLEKVGVKAISDGGKLGGFGNFWTSIYDSAVTPIKTIGGQVLYRVGDQLEFVGEKGLKTFSEFLKSKGYTIKK
jgi:hypothetical protein